MKALNSKERKALKEKLVTEYGYSGDFDFTVFANEESKYYVATRNVEPFLDAGLRIERVGIYVFVLQHGELRMSIEGSQLFGPHCTKGVLDISTTQRDAWMLGNDVRVTDDTEQRIFMVRCGEDYLAGGKVKNGVLLNHVPKERRVGATFDLEVD